MFFEDIGLKVPELLLPSDSVDLTRWSVIACDQHTAKPQYWKQVEDMVGDQPSTLNIIYPEVYMGSEDRTARVNRIVEHMNRYLEAGVLTPQKPGFIAVERTLASGRVRKGLVAALDLEGYDYSPDSKSLIRPTEGTYIDKVHTRVEVREKAPLEASHILVLIDDPEKTVIEPLFKKKLEKAYDFELMIGGGRVKGYRVDDEVLLEEVADSLRKLHKMEGRYSGGNGILYAMGDGNHSFATAKTVWEKVKKDGGGLDHPARYAVVELVNIHDPGLWVGPIHRVLSNVKAEDVLAEMESFFTGQGSVFNVGEDSGEGHHIPYVSGSTRGTITIKKPKAMIETGSLEAFLDHYITVNRKAKVDFIHGEDVVYELGSRMGSVGFILPDWDKNEIFDYVTANGPFPRKTISMGRADEKRYYVECRKIVE